MVVQRRCKRVAGICRRARGYMSVQRRYKGVEGSVEGYEYIWENKENIREILYKKGNGNTRKYWARYLEGWFRFNPKLRQTSCLRLSPMKE